MLALSGSFSGSIWLLLAYSGSLWLTLAHSGSLWLSLARCPALSGSLWLTLAHSGSLWLAARLSLAPSGSLRLSLALYCSPNLLTKPLLGSQGPCSAWNAVPHFNQPCDYGRLSGLYIVLIEDFLNSFIEVNCFCQNLFHVIYN